MATAETITQSLLLLFSQPKSMCKMSVISTLVMLVGGKAVARIST